VYRYCTCADVGGVGRIPELNGSGPKDFDIICCADKKPSGDVIYRGFVRVGNKQASDILEWIEGAGKNEVIIKNFGSAKEG
jgi:hypothetical protein